MQSIRRDPLWIQQLGQKPTTPQHLADRVLEAFWHMRDRMGPGMTSATVKGFVMEGIGSVREGEAYKLTIPGTHPWVAALSQPESQPESHDDYGPTWEDQLADLVAELFEGQWTVEVCGFAGNTCSPPRIEHTLFITAGQGSERARMQRPELTWSQDEWGIER